MDSTNNNQPIEDSLSEMMKSVKDREQDAVRQLRETVLPEVRSLGVVSIEIEYSGYGDEGALEHSLYLNAAGESVGPPTINCEMCERLENCVYQLLPAGFEINEGGQGVVLINTQTGTITVKHNENYTETRSSEYTF